MLVSYFMITYSFVFGKLKGSSYLLRAHGKGGASATILSSLSVPPSEKIAGGFQQAGKKEGGWGEGIFARLLLSGGMAEGGFGGNSAMPERIQKEAAPAACSVRSRSQQKSFLFLLEEKIRRAQNQKCRENFFASWRALASGGGAASAFGVVFPLKESSREVYNYSTIEEIASFEGSPRFARLKPPKARKNNQLEPCFTGKKKRKIFNLSYE